MILYFADRFMNIVGQVSTNLPKGLTVTNDKKTEDVETGSVIFECKIPYEERTRDLVTTCCAVGNYLLRSHEDENEFYTIMETEEDTDKGQIYIYAEDAGMDLLNDVFGAYEPTQAYPITHYIEKYAGGAGFIVGTNEAVGLTRKLVFDGEQTAAQRLVSVANQFDGCEISFSFAVDGLMVTKKYINVFKERGADHGIQLRLNKEVDSIITTKSITNLATALLCTGGTPEDENTSDNIDPAPITLEGYTYDDGDFYVDGTYLKSREALKTWARFLTKTETASTSGGHIVKLFSYDTLSQSELCNRAITELKTLREMEVNYDVEIKETRGAKVGDRVNIVDDAGGLYLSSRILTLETSVCDNSIKAIIGEHLIRGSGIAQKVLDLAAEFAKNAYSATRALAIANHAKNQADVAQQQADDALESATAAQETANEAQKIADQATQSATTATEAANEARAQVDAVEKSVEGLQTTVTNAQAAADNAYKAAETAQTKAEEAQAAAQEALTDAADAKEAAETAETTAGAAVGKANDAIAVATESQELSATAQETAQAAKVDAEQAKKDIEAFSQNLTTLEQTMKADYARKTDLTETQAALQTQITQNAAGITANASSITRIDETANNASALAQAAQDAAQTAQTRAEAATADAQAAQNAADEAKTAAQNAQSEADTAAQAAVTAKQTADKAESDLAAAKADLETVTGRVGATEEEIAAAQKALETAQAAADTAKADAQAAAQAASAAQSKADAAAADATAAQNTANEAASNASLAQQVAQEAKGNAAAAQAKADEAAQTAADAQATANSAKANAESAQETANNAADAAQVAQNAADEADAKAAQAAQDLAAAQENLENVVSRVGATEEEVAAAKAAVELAQAAADTAKSEAAAAQTTADRAKADADAAQAAADTAKNAADAAQAAADAAQEQADAALEETNALAVRTTAAETNIAQNAEALQLSASKEYVMETLGGYVKTEEYSSLYDQNAERTMLSFNAKIEELQAENAALQGSINTINKFFVFDINGFTIGQENSPYKIVIDNDELMIKAANGDVIHLDALGNGIIPVLRSETVTISRELNLLGLLVSGDDTHVNVSDIGG